MIQLGSKELKAVQKLQVFEERQILQHSTPASGGQIPQDLGRKRARIVLEGVFLEASAGQDLIDVTQMLQKGEPMPFSCDNVPISQVVLQKLEYSQQMGLYKQISYTMHLEEWQTVSNASAANLRGSVTLVLGNIASNAIQQVSQKITQQAQSTVSNMLKGF